MKTFNRAYLIVISLTLILNATPLKGQANKYSPDVEEKITRVQNNLAGWVQTQDKTNWTLAERMKVYNVQGVSIAVVHNYKIEWARGFGFADVSEKRPVTEKTLFQAASISKTFNAIGILKLVQEGRLDLKRDINDYLVSWKFPYDEKSGNKKITLENLLSHTAGLTVHGFPGYEKGASLPTLQQVLDGQKPANTEAVRSTSEPGSKFNYSGGGVMISQVILDDATHQPYDKFMKKNVLDPMGMKSSFFTQPPSDSKAGLLATGYKPDGTEVKGKYHIYPEQAAAGLWTNPVDLCKYIIETQLSYQGKSSGVLTPEMTRLRLTPVMQEAALGVFVATKGTSKYFMHNGGNEGFSCQYVGSLEDGEGVVVMTNSDNGSLIEEIVNSVAIVYNWKDYYQPEIKKVVDVGQSVLDKYTGKYDAAGSLVTIKKGDNGLLLSVGGNIWWQLLFTSDTEFFLKEYRGDMKFTVGNDDKVTGFTFNGMTVKKTE
jgi:CubicO group peptidase (beta-lactamase class C family)